MRVPDAPDALRRVRPVRSISNPDKILVAGIGGFAPATAARP